MTLSYGWLTCFFFQAEDGIRDVAVTGVQTCALPIYRSSLKAFRGPGMKEGLRILEKIKKEFKVPVLTDIHEASQAEAVAEIGRASCRERGEISGVAGSLKKKKKRRCRWQK